MKQRRGRRRLTNLYNIFSKPAYVIIAVAAAAAFYYLFQYLVSSSNNGIFLINISIYFVYVLVATSGILFSISVFAVFYSLASRSSEAAGGIASILIPSIGGLVASCGCAFPIIASVLLFFGINTLEAAGIISLISSLQLWIMLAMILVNLAIIYYYSGRLSMPSKRGKK